MRRVMSEETEASGLCSTCGFARIVESTRGSGFLMCLRWRDDARFPKYPPLPVLRCAGYEARDEEEDGG